KLQNALDFSPNLFHLVPPFVVSPDFRKKLHKSGSFFVVFHAENFKQQTFLFLRWRLGRIGSSFEVFRMFT
ncbi:MAG: hypothetical protein Q4A65_08335, partial [Bacillota bacterium]|nr:hypothetical protein [Bacillota bacterium]